MYWNNPIEGAKVGLGYDIIKQSQHQGQHCLFYSHHIAINQIRSMITLASVCELANDKLSQGRLLSGDEDQIANIVKINQYVHSLRSIGIVKPMLLYYTGQLPYEPSTGSSRLAAASLVPGLKYVPAFISTHERFRNKFPHLREIASLSEFAEVCSVPADTEFAFRLTDANADYGIDWYEMPNRQVPVPSIDWCLQVLGSYVNTQPQGFKFTPGWFKQRIDWEKFNNQ